MPTTGGLLRSSVITVLLISSIIYRHALGAKITITVLSRLIRRFSSTIFDDRPTLGAKKFICNRTFDDFLTASMIISSPPELVFSVGDVILHSGVNGCFQAGR
jgi:hypothetical protein